MEQQAELGQTARREPPPLVDAAFGVAALAIATAGSVTRRLQDLAGPVTRAVLQPAILPPRLQPATGLSAILRRGAAYRGELRHELVELLDELVPRLVSELLRRVELTELVLQHVDLNRVLLEVDLDATVGRVDVDALASRLDLEAVVGRLDLMELVRQHLDLDGLVGVIDLDAVAAKLDLDAVIQRVDLVGLARAVIAEIDLPEIIRGSTGAMASDTLLGVRMQSISADDALGRGVDRLRHRWTRRSRPAGPAQPLSVVPSDQVDSSSEELEKAT